MPHVGSTFTPCLRLKHSSVLQIISKNKNYGHPAAQNHQKRQLARWYIQFSWRSTTFFQSHHKISAVPWPGTGRRDCPHAGPENWNRGGAKSSNIGNGKCLTYINISKNGKSILKSMVKKWKKGCSYFGWNHKNKAENWEQQPSRLISGPYCRWWKGRKTSLDSITD